MYCFLPFWVPGLLRDAVHYARETKSRYFLPLEKGKIFFVLNNFIFRNGGGFAHMKDVSGNRKVQDLREELKLIEQDLPPSDFCLDFLQKAPDYHDGRLHKSLRQRIREHLETCEWCREKDRQFREVFRGAEEGTLEDAPQWVYDMGKKKFDEYKSSLPGVLGERIAALRGVAENLCTIKVSGSDSSGHKKTGHICGKGSPCRIRPGSTLFIEIVPSMTEKGHAVIVYRDEKTIKLVFPARNGETTLIPQGEEKVISWKTGNAPAGCALSAFYTGERLLPEKIRYRDELSVRRAIKEFLDRLEQADPSRWCAHTIEYEVTDEKAGIENEQ
jgi:translation initiation factor IF-1